jgi:hypothetical protein
MTEWSDAQAGTVVIIGGVFFLSVVGIVLAARLAKPVIDHVAAVDLTEVTVAFESGLRDLAARRRMSAMEAG